MNIKKIMLYGVIAIVVIIGCLFTIYKVSLSPVSSENNKEIVDVEIKEGLGRNSIAELLKKKKVIKSALATKVYFMFNNVKTLQAGIYSIDTSCSTKEIIEQISKGKTLSSEIKITFIEGKNMRYYAKVIAENTENSEQDVFNLLKNEEYIDSLIEKYWFLTDEIKNDDIYYPLEGYLLPDTYSFENKYVSVEKIFEVLLSYMDKLLTEKKSALPSNFTVHELLSLASIAEVEGLNYEDRQEIVGVFINRLNAKMQLGSDVTTYYAFKIDVGSRDLTADEISTSNPYNTRGPYMGGKLPVGPVCNPSKSAIEATIDYKETDAYYFVADKNGKIYFTKNNEEHINMINKLKKQGLWFTY